MVCYFGEPLSAQPDRIVTTWTGKPFDKKYTETRARFERLVENDGVLAQAIGLIAVRSLAPLCPRRLGTSDAVGIT
jgi:hypothetical protein